jgi:tRNA-modifying protein YgfZ
MNKISYQASLTGAAFFFQREAGIIRVSGPSRMEFLQRQTTGDVNLLSPERGLLSVLTSPTARILDVLYLVAPPSAKDEFLDIITLPGRGQSTTHFLKSKIFFNDNVTITDLSNEFLQLDILGEEAERVVRSLLGESFPNESEVIRTEINQSSLLIIQWVKGTGLGRRLIFPKEASESVFSFFDQEQVIEISEDVYNTRRIEEGLPWIGKEFTDAYTPLEVNLREAVSDSKGCYTGQEVIARQITYNKVTRKMVGLTLSDLLEAGSEIRSGDRTVGNITSAALSPRFGPVALAIIKRPYYETGTPLLAIDQDKEIQSAVSALPFK